MSSNDWQKIELITSSEHHFNNLCFRIRTLASTWLLATMGGVGFLLSQAIDTNLEANHLLVVLCWVGAIGILVLWVIDLLIYQKMLNAWFASREQIENRNEDFPQIWRDIKATQPGGRASNLIKLFYQALVALPMGLSVYVSFYLGMHQSWSIMSALLMLLMLAGVYILSPKDSDTN